MADGCPQKSISCWGCSLLASNLTTGNGIAHCLGEKNFMRKNRRCAAVRNQKKTRNWADRVIALAVGIFWCMLSSYNIFSGSPLLP